MKLPKEYIPSKKSMMNRLLCVRMTLNNVVYISYAVPATKLRKIVPEPLQLATSGKDTAFISIVILRNTRVRLRILPLFRFNYSQLNIRTYVIDPISGQHAVYFIRSGITSAIVSLVTRISGIPCQLIDLNIDVDPHKETGSYLAKGNWQGNYSIKYQIASEDVKEMPLFKNNKDAIDFLIRPLIGFIGDK